jgi:4'-phosphopantetheinyl transferase
MMVPNFEKDGQASSSTGGASSIHAGRLSLEMGHAVAWFALLTDLAPNADNLRATLAHDEIERAERFKFQKGKEQYVLGRGFLREILSCYCGIEADKLRFRYGARGKPYLIEEQAGSNFMFNYAQTKAAVLCAITREAEIGVDIEYVTNEIDDQALAEQYFSPDEATALSALPVGARQRAFLKCWTRKEAYIKAKGEGLHLDLKSFEVFDSAESAARLHIENNPKESARWTLVDLDVPGDYIAALAIESQNCRVNCRQWSRRMINR